MTNVLVLVKVAISVFVVVVGAFFITKSNLVPFIPKAVPADTGGSALDRPLIETFLGGAPSHFGVAGILTAAAVVFFAYTGFEAVANLGEESKRPERDMPRALIGTLLACTVLYVLVSIVLTGMVEYTDIDSSAPLSKAFESVGASWAGSLVAIAAVAGLTSVILVELVTMGRIGYAMGRDGPDPALGRQGVAQVRNAGAVHRDRGGGVRPDGRLHPDRGAVRDGQHRRPVRVPPGIPGGTGAAAHQARPEAAVPSARSRR